MNATVIRNGSWSALLLLGLFSLPLIFLGIPGPEDLMNSEVVGHIFILVSLGFVFVGMKQYREANGGTLSYWQAVKTGLLISIFPAIAFGLYNVLYVEVIDPDFMTKYAEHTINNRSVGKTAEEVIAIRESTLAEMETFSNPAINFLVMFLSVFIMGTIVSLVSAFFVKKDEAA